ncbi:MAG: hypothetical protein RL385_1154 [Pseudomonadota bacterium]|jgi:DNA-binding transcriptional regulator YiaG
MCIMNLEALSKELLVALRGRHPQQRISRKLGYRSNIVYRWETGRCAPSADKFFAFVDACGGDMRRALGTFFGDGATLPKPLAAPRAVGEILARLRGKLEISELARQMGRSRFVVSRWLDGTTQLRLPELLLFIEQSTLRLLDFLAALVPPERLPSARSAWAALEASRRAAFDHPWSHAVLRVLETSAYKRLKAHKLGWIAARLGLSIEEEEACVSVLREAQQIRIRHGRYVVCDTRPVDVRGQDDKRDALRAFWMRVAADRHARGVPGIYGFNLFSVSALDYEKIQAMQRAHFEAVRHVIAESRPEERVVLMATQIVPLDCG